MLTRYLADLRPATTILWCYFIWYAVTVINHFDPNPRLWLNSLGISMLIGTALVLSVGPTALRASTRWITFRLFLMPFCVSSFAALIKDRGFLLVLPPDRVERWLTIAPCLAFLVIVTAIKRTKRRPLLERA